jgi:hypothetical protein
MSRAYRCPIFRFLFYSERLSMQNKDGKDMRVTDQLKGVCMQKYRRRLSRIHRPSLNQIQLLALELYVRQQLKDQGRLDCVDVDGQFLDHIDLTCNYDENKAKMDELLSGRPQAEWILREMKAR